MAFRKFTIGDERAGLITVEGTLVYRILLLFKNKNGCIVFVPLECKW